MNTMFRLIVLTLIACVGAPSALAKTETLPDVTVEGLQRVKDSKLAIVYAEPGADLSVYDSVNLMEPYVAFKKNWARDQRRSASSLSMSVKKRDIEMMKTKMAKEFDAVFSQVLTDGGYQVTEDTGESVLLVRPAIIDLDPNAPDISTASNTQTYTRSAGAMSLYIELYDSLTGDLIAKALDRQSDGSSSHMFMWSNPASNAAASKRILRKWAETLRDALDESRR